MPVRIKKIEFGDVHTCVIGITGSGKTYGTIHSLRAVLEPVIFFNTKHDFQVPNNFLVMTRDNSYIQLKRALVRGRKINYLPARDERLREVELSNLIRFLFDASRLPVFLVVDEVHLYNKRGVYYKLMEVATTGRSYGIKAIWMSQRPANIDNNLMTQCEKFIIFRCSLEHQYLKRYGFPVEEMERLFQEGGQYSYLEFDMLHLKGPFKVK